MAEKKIINKAVAIVYDEKESAAPKVVASGKGVVAENNHRHRQGSRNSYPGGCQPG